MSDNIQPIVDFAKPRVVALPELVAGSIRRSIQDGRLAPGQQLPPEPELAQQLGISRTTLRDAVRILVGQGALERRRGIGTFVALSPLLNISEGLEFLASTTDVIARQGYQPGTSESVSEIVPATDDLAQILDVGQGSPLLHLSRTRTANGQPVIHCEEYVPVQLLPPELVQAGPTDWSLYEVLRQQDRAVTTALCKIVAVSADERLAERLHLPVRHPLLLLRQTHYAADHRPVLYCENYHNCSVIDFHLIRRS
jgi:GntR family transcriptional regulator